MAMRERVAELVIGTLFAGTVLLAIFAIGFSLFGEPLPLVAIPTIYGMSAFVGLFHVFGPTP